MSRGERAGTGAHGSVRPGAMGTCLAGVYVVRMGHGRWIWWSGRRVRDREGKVCVLRQMGRFSRR